MKNSITFFLFIVLSTTSFSQNLQSANWFVGDDHAFDDSRSVTILNFQSDTMQMERREEIRGISFSLATASISDDQGNLLFYTNGCYVYNKEHERMRNGNRINIGSLRQFCNQGTSYASGHASIIIVPDSYKNKEYYIFHQKIADDLTHSQLNYTKVDLSLDDGLGQVIIHDQIIMEDSVDNGEMAMVKHSNGKDWWLIAPTDSSNVYNIVIIDSLGARKTHQQSLGVKVGGNGTGQVKFSHDGRRLARWTFDKQLLLADFARSTGEFSNDEQIHVSDTISIGGVEFSPNNRFLYVSSGYHIHQFDLWEDDLAASQITIAEWDGFTDVFRTFFRRMQLTPDCRIFISSPGGHRYWHVIQNPNEKGLACNLEQHALLLPTRTFNTMTYYPNYSLGALGNEGYPCDSTKTKITYSSVDVSAHEEYEALVFPNPTSGSIQIDLPPNVGEMNFQLFDMAGSLVFTKNGIFPFEEIHLEDILNGMYFYRAYGESGTNWSGKLIVNR